MSTLRDVFALRRVLLNQMLWDDTYFYVAMRCSSAASDQARSFPRDNDFEILSTPTRNNLIHEINQRLITEMEPVPPAISGPTINAGAFHLRFAANLHSWRVAVPTGRAP